MKENHQEIAETITNRLFEPGQFTGKIWCKERITKELDAAHADGDKAGYERGVRDSAEKAAQHIGSVGAYITYRRAPLLSEETADAILSLIAPPVPVCCEHVRWSNGGWWLVSQVSDHSWPWSAEECPVCGEAVKQSKGN